ncbi:MAG: 3-phosphoshikimate 1-carboxyvinyltransferase [Sedimentisphaerales bacterium]|nr:3-phosphoshikimate 1-carboxyvinyltransferase [Sedimentisphaerales bacterium]
MKLIAKKSRLKGTVTIPASKSHTIRAVAIASLASGDSVIRAPLLSGDTSAVVNAYQALGAKIDTSDPAAWKVSGSSGRIAVPEKTIDVLNSGTTLRIAMGSAALAPPGRPIRFTGDDQIQARPVAPLIDALNDLGAECASLKNNGCAPVKIAGTLKGGKTAIACKTSQYLSSLLLCTPLAEQDSEINVTLLNEPDYVRMTLDWLDKQQIEYENESMRRFRIKGRQAYKPFDAAIPADFSSATFFLCAAALLGDEVTILGLDFADSQPDKAVVDYLKAMGADIAIAPDRVIVKAAPLRAAEIDMNRTPDALPAMAVTAAFAEGTTKLLNVPQARFKETDRIKCMAAELTKMAVNVEELPDGLIIHGTNNYLAPRFTGGFLLHGHADHRIVMALAVAGLALENQSTIDTAEAMSVTFPDFANLMQSLGANIKTTK